MRPESHVIFGANDGTGRYDGRNVRRKLKNIRILLRQEKTGNPRVIST